MLRSSGSNALINTAAAYPFLSVTAFTQWCIPYTRYTYATPGFPNITSVRAVLPRAA
jgi:hypothetical protein